MENDNHESNNRLVLFRSLTTGFIGGVFWSLLAQLLSLFNFTEIGPFDYISEAILNQISTKWLKFIITLMILGILSVIIASIYYLLFKKLTSMWIGVIYGVVLWLVVFFLLPYFTSIPTFATLQTTTVITTITLFILYGVFIGYSISFDYYEINTLK